MYCMYIREGKEEGKEGEGHSERFFLRLLFLELLLIG